MRAGRTTLAALFAACLIVFSLPIAEWWPGGLRQARYAAVLSQWGLWALMAAGGAVLAGLAARRGFDGAVFGRLLRQAGDDAQWRRTVWSLAGLHFVLASAVAWRVFSGRPITIDELVQAFQARLFASGRLWEAAPAHPEFTSALNLVEHQGRVFGHFPPGGPAVLAVGELLGARWLAVPLTAAGGILMLGLLLRRIEPSPPVRALALLLAALSPFAVFMAGTQLNHTPLLALQLAALAVAADPTARPVRQGAVAGLLTGLASLLRPLDAAVVALPLAGYFALGDRPRVPRCLGFAAGVLAGGLPLLLYNLATTGQPLLLGYRLLWGPDVGLGFHDAPWGEPFTLQLGVERTGNYILQLNAVLAEAGMPALLPVVLGLCGWRRASPRAGLETAWLAVALLTLLAYTAYWHNGIYLGPRFLHGLVPLTALWAARGVAWAASVAVPIGRQVVLGGAGASLVCAAILLPDRVGEYGRMLRTSRRDLQPLLAAAGARSGTVFVPESWGAQVLARLWARGVPRWTAEQLYRRVDLCRLDQAVRAYESAGERIPPGALRVLMRDSLQLRPSPVSGDSSELWQPSHRYDALCLAALERERAGFTTAAPYRLDGPEGLVWARDLGARNAVAAELPRPWWRLRAPPDGRWSIVPYETTAASSPPAPSR